MMKTITNDKKIGSVMVVGGGIAGIQASVDLAESGFKVHLVERSPSIGGTMAQLDKTFPTNDCAMCIMSPKLVECGRHKNVQIHTCSEVLGLDGDAGNFKARVLKRARYVDLSKCTGCGDCEKACPVSMKSEFEQQLTTRKAVYRPFPQAFPNAFAIDKAKRAPCVRACPAGVNAQGYVALVGMKKFKEALALVREAIPFPASIGRVCNHPCEQNCKRGEYDQPIAICSLKRFIADYETANGDGNGQAVFKPEAQRTEKVAVVGAGPAGLTCANYLAKRGYPVTIFEALPVNGGMLAVGIPEYRLPKAVLNKEIAAILKNGVELKSGVRVGTDITLEDLKAQGYKAVFLGIGAHKGLKLGIEGESLQGVMDCVTFLREINLGKKIALGKKLMVVGGGNAAIDSARMALRLGASQVTILYRRSRAEMPANPAEIEEAEHEGVKIHYLAAPIKIIGENGRLSAVECIKMELGKPDASGRRRPVPVKGSEFTIEVDTLIPAISQSPDLAIAENGGAGVKVNKWGYMEADEKTCATPVPWIFTGGDAVTGPAMVVDAIAAGKRAAVSIDKYIRGEKLEPVSFHVFDETLDERDFPDIIEDKQRARMPSIPVTERLGGFAEVELGFSEETAVAEAQRCLSCGVCSECMECVKACKANAIVHDSKDAVEELNVGAVVLAPGFEEFDPRRKFDYGYTSSPNVVTSIEFERILSASGPYKGHVQRPGDGKTPKKVAWIQCVGSRDPSVGNEYCSSVCCMYAIKEAVIAREHVRTIEPTIFFMDMRAYGKDFDKYYERAKNQGGVRFVRARVQRIKEVDGTGDLTLYYESEDGQFQTETFDMVVLSVGLEPCREFSKMARRLGLRVNEHRFAETNPINPLETTRRGVFICGPAGEPKDIPETVAQASGAAAMASSLLSSVRGTEVTPKQYPKEKDLRGEPPRVGVFVCHCGINIGGVVRVSEVVQYAKTLPNVVYAEENLYTCSQDTQDKIRALVEEHGLNRVVVASCTPRTHEPLFRETLREAGLNPYLFEMANIRDQCSWVHMNEPGKATEKSKDLLRMAVSKARLTQPLQRLLLNVTQKALVIGGGVAGMTAALRLADEGYPCYLVEREAELGGNARHIHYNVGYERVASALWSLQSRVNAHPLITVFLNASVKSIEGFVGNFSSTIEHNSEETKIDHGVVIVATGAKELKPKEYLYGEDPRVVTQQQLEEKIASGKYKPKPGENIVMVQCVGSRNEERPYCSRVCCSQAVKNAVRIKKMERDANVYVLFRDVRTYGFREVAYEEARDLGVIFIRYEPEQKPEAVLRNGKLRIKTRDILVGVPLEIDADLLALSVAIVPEEGNESLAQMLKVPLNADKFFLEAHMKLRPVEFATDGVFLAGLAHSPKSLEESVSQANGAVSRACVVLSKDKIEAEGTVAMVNELRCAGCGMCEAICAHSAVQVKMKTVMRVEKLVAEVNEALCKGCGACAASCRSGSINLRGFTDEQIFAQVTALGGAR